MANKSQKKSASPLVRGEAIVARILDAAITELAEVGYHAFSYERVAERAGVARTTVYRRYPTKADLIIAAIEALPGSKPGLLRGDSLRADVIRSARMAADFALTPYGMSVFRLFVERLDDDLEQVLGHIRTSWDRMNHSIFERAAERGEISRTNNVSFVAELIPAAVLHRVVVLRQPATKRWLSQLADTVELALS